MSRKVVSIILPFILAILAGSVIYFLSARVTTAERPYQVAIVRKDVVVLMRRLEERMEGRIKLLEAEVDKLGQETEELKKSLTTYKTETSKELNELRALLEDQPHQ